MQGWSVSPISKYCRKGQQRHRSLVSEVQPHFQRVITPHVGFLKVQRVRVNVDTSLQAQESVAAITAPLGVGDGINRVRRIMEVLQGVYRHLLSSFPHHEIWIAGLLQELVSTIDMNLSHNFHLLGLDCLLRVLVLLFRRFRWTCATYWGHFRRPAGETSVARKILVDAS